MLVHLVHKYPMVAPRVSHLSRLVGHGPEKKLRATVSLWTAGPTLSQVAPSRLIGSWTAAQCAAIDDELQVLNCMSEIGDRCEGHALR